MNTFDRVRTQMQVELNQHEASELEVLSTLLKQGYDVYVSIFGETATNTYADMLESAKRYTMRNSVK